MYVSSKDAQHFFKVSSDTLRRWADENKIKTIKTKGGHRRYLIQQSNQLQNKKDKEGEKVIYARVSSKKQESDLNRQIIYLSNKYPNHKVISDIASGINFKRPGFNSILDGIFNGNIKEIVVFSHDILLRFVFELFQNICSKFDTKLIVDSDTTKYKSPSEELAEDLLSIVTIFTAKYHRSRKYKNSQDSKKDSNISIKKTQKISK